MFNWFTNSEKECKNSSYILLEYILSDIKEAKVAKHINWIAKCYVFLNRTNEIQFPALTVCPFSLEGYNDEALNYYNMSSKVLINNIVTTNTMAADDNLEDFLDKVLFK